MIRRSRGSGSSRAWAWFLLGYCGLAGFLALEAATREQGSAATLDPSDDDQGTTRMIVTGFAIGAVVTPILRAFTTRPMPPAAARIGLGLEGLGIALRAWSMRTLRGSYSRTLRTEDDQPVVESGPYAIVRHLGYLGSLLTWVGFALTSRSRPALIVVGLVLGRAYRRRIEAEERLLERELPSYAAYAARTWRLIPFVW